jgi:hypothetical protein
MMRATAQDFERWKAACIADPSKLDSLPKNMQTYWRNEFGIGEPTKPVVRLTNNSTHGGLGKRLQLHDDATFEEIAEFAFQLGTLMDFLPDDVFQQALDTTAKALSHIGATWDDALTYMKAGAK